MNWRPVIVKCDICGDRSHPTNDCPQKNRINNKFKLINKKNF